MPSLRNMRLQIRSVKSISQVTRALEAVSASRVRKAQLAVLATRQYAAKALQILQHLSEQPGIFASTGSLHPLLQARQNVRTVTIVLFTSDRGLCGAYNTNALRAALNFAREQTVPVRFVAIGKKGRDLLLRRRQDVVGEFIHVPATPAFVEIAPIGRLVVDDFLAGRTDRVYLVYTEFVNMLRQVPHVMQVLPLQPESEAARKAAGEARAHGPLAAYTYEPSREELLDVIIPRFTQLQVYQALLEAQASEHAARMTAMRNATDNAKDLINSLQLDYNKARQLSITSDMLDIAGGAEALAKAG